MRIVGEIPRIALPSPAEFERQYRSAHFPVIIRSAVDDWPARRWTPEGLRQRFGERLVPVRRSDDEIAVVFGAEREETSLPFSRFIDAITAPVAPGAPRPPYVANHSIGVAEHDSPLDELRAEIQFPEFVGGALRSVQVWIGAPGQRSTIHNDPYDNFNAQLYGRKRFLMFPPGQHEHVYPERIHEGFWSSPVDPGRPDPARHPLFSKAEALEGVLEPGDMIYVPIFWWHYVEALTVSINASAFGGHSEGVWTVLRARRARGRQASLSNG